MFLRYLILFLSAVILREVIGHGMMIKPTSRSSIWRFDASAPPNYDDDGLFCGGLEVQWDEFNGKCGLCGDRYDMPHPQPNENTGTYGRGKIVASYQAGSVIDIDIILTANHKGNMKYSLCVLEDPSAPESGEDCFKPLKLGDGSTQYNVVRGEFNITHTLQLPKGLTCDRCVLRWTYTAGNNWGDCGNGTYADGCGPQETFKNCADITLM